MIESCTDFIGILQSHFHFLLRLIVYIFVKCKTLTIFISILEGRKLKHLKWSFALESIKKG